MTIAGELDPFDPLKKLDITTSFKRVELTTPDAYSGKFAGYRIRKGDSTWTCTTRSGSQLKAENKVLLEGLQLGEKVDSPDANGPAGEAGGSPAQGHQGQHRYPVAGGHDLNNPEFSVMPIVWQTPATWSCAPCRRRSKFIAGLAAGGNGSRHGTLPRAATS